MLLADQDPLARRAAREALLREDDFAIVGEVTDGLDAVATALAVNPDVVLMDVDLPGISWIAATRQISDGAPSVRVVVLAIHEDVELGLRVLDAGAAGFLSKDIDRSALARSLRGVFRGEAAISRHLAMRLIEQLRTVPGWMGGISAASSPLTNREWQVFELLARGDTIADIARELDVAPGTVRRHIKRIRRKVGGTRTLEPATPPGASAQPGPQGMRSGRGNPSRPR